MSTLVARAGGNPLLIEELADADGDAASLQLAVLARCRELPEDQLEGLAMLVTAGRPLPTEHVPGLAGLVESGLVGADERVASVRHALIGEVLGQTVSQERRTRCHQRLATVLTHPGEVARHLLAAGRPGEAYAFAMRAVEEAHTPGERVPHLETAARCVDPAQGAEFRLQAVEAANEVDECDIAASLLEEVPDRPDLRFRIARARGIIAYFRGDSEGHRAAVEEEQRLARPGTEEEVLALSEASFVKLVLDGAYEEATPMAERAADLAQRIGAGRVAALKAVADTYYLSADPRWAEAYPAALEQARAEDDFAREWRIANNYISATETFGPHESSRRLAREMVERCRELRVLGLQRNFEFRELNLAGHAAQYDVVLAKAPALASLSSGMAVQFANDLLFTLACAQADVGDVEQGLETAEQILERDNERGRSNYHLLRSWAFLDDGRPDQVLIEEKAFREVDVDPARIALATPVFAWAAYETGAPHPDMAPDAPDYGMLAGACLETRAIASLRAEEHATAAAGFAEAAAAYDGLHQRAATRCRWAHGEALRLAGDPGAQAALEAAEDHARQLRMVAVVRRCQRSLRALGVRRSAGVSRSAGSPLTAREREVVLLAADGLTDKAIAARLGVAHRTVQTQVANARRKLGAENRRHLISLVTGAD
ncbi:LuxR C-terminal-related transcriptional regulator [Nocardioides sp. TF02-7]|uniref:LuxR C-terminal-related transcriptional regulator n=1 Tax=Nocardioides sp. TF02-7 TaxID=2917724 RepID=UPI001F06BFD8|nr:LuxR C-terminal-related transcriptional regulator [Nocardioides sp. TF02-7]UMG94605.1 LuxR C-terminal-related transcriptional regulator [Nocardioides sp. TF02-7]